MQELLLLTSQVETMHFYICARLNSSVNVYLRQSIYSILIGSGKTDNFTQKQNFQ